MTMDQSLGILEDQLKNACANRDESENRRRGFQSSADGCAFQVAAFNKKIDDLCAAIKLIKVNQGLLERAGHGK